MESSTATFDPAFLAAFRTGSLTPSQVEAVLPRDRGAVIFLLLPLSARRAAEAGTPASGAHTPSGSRPPYSEPKTSSRGKTKPGAQKGHRGHSRAKPARIDRRETHRCPVCPECGGELHRTGRTRTRVVEDLPENGTAEATEPTTHRDWCPGCRKQVEPNVPDALPRCTLGNRTLARTAWRFSGIATTLRPIVEVFHYPLQMKRTPGGSMPRWHRPAEVLLPWYEQIRSCGRDAGVLHADETGWRVEGKTGWWWCFRTADATDYRIDRSRGHPALDRLFAEEFDGVLVADFWAASDAVGRWHPKCWPHLVRDVTEGDEGQDHGDDGPAFRKRWRRLYGDAIRRVAARTTRPKDASDWRHAKRHARRTDLAVAEWTNPHARRLAKRLFQYGEYRLTFVEFEGVPADNNPAEREIRPAVLMRKTSYGTDSERGSRFAERILTVVASCRQQGRNILQFLIDAIDAQRKGGPRPSLIPQGA
jgi:transposase